MFGVRNLRSARTRFLSQVERSGRRCCNNNIKNSSSSSDGHIKTGLQGTKARVAALGVGLISGIGGSLVGLGGASLAVPFLSGPFALSQHLVTGTTMAVALCTSFGASLAYSRKVEGNLEGNIDYPTAFGIASTGAIFSYFGAMASKALSARFLLVSRGILMLAIAPTIPYRDVIVDKLKQIFPSDASTKKSHALSPTTLSFLSPVLVPLNWSNEDAAKAVYAMRIGIFSGFQAGFFGVGGGAIMMPSIALTTDLPYQALLGTSLAAMLPTAFVGALKHYQQGTMVGRLAVPLGAGCVAGSFVAGSIASHGLIDERYLKGLFSIFMFVLGARQLGAGLLAKSVR